MRTRAAIPVLLVLLAAGCGNGCGTPPRPDPSPAQPEQESGSLTVSVTGLRSADGVVLITVFDGPEGFPSSADRAAARSRAEPATDTPVNVAFPDLRAGRYAVSVVHDENANGVLDRNFLGMPTEGYGVSNNPELGYGPPTWEQANVVVPDGGGVVSVIVRYR